MSYVGLVTGGTEERASDSPEACTHNRRDDRLASVPVAPMGIDPKFKEELEAATEKLNALHAALIDDLLLMYSADIAKQRARWEAELKARRSLYCGSASPSLINIRNRRYCAYNTAIVRRIRGNLRESPPSIQEWYHKQRKTQSLIVKLAQARFDKECAEVAAYQKCCEPLALAMGI